MMCKDSLKVNKSIKDWLSWTRSQQLLASDPNSSAWVSANAGSGKTHILVLRVLRLFLANVNPSTILCLTHTNAAAAEMSNRVFEIITEWSHLSDEKLFSEIQKIQNKRPSKKDIRIARQLLLKILETPGEWKAKTIHSFCETIIQQFPLEANTTGHFSVLDEEQSKKLIEEAKKSTLASIMSVNNIKLRQAFDEILELTNEQTLEKLISDIVSNRNNLNRFSCFANKNGGEETLLKKRFGLPPDEKYEKIYTELSKLLDVIKKDINQYINLTKGNDSSKKTEIFKAILKEKSIEKSFDFLSYLFITTDLSPRKNLLIKKIDINLEKKFKNHQEVFIKIRDRLNTYKMLKATLASLTLAKHLNDNHHKLKKKYCFLDFEDLISYTNDLLKKSEVSSWIRYKLDQEINHILIDEAQDTSLIQWEVIRSLTDDFFVGENAHSNPRTLFAVGDEKQSIFSFQGAEHSRFFRERKINKQRITNSGNKFSIVQLPLSFRSTADILTSVDKVFSIPENAQGLSEENDPILHRSNRIGHPGSVQIWEQAFSEIDNTKKDWISNFDSIPRISSKSIIAKRIANKISDMIGNDTIISNGKKRLVRADDIMILVRKRTSFIKLLTRFLKNEHQILVSNNDKLLLTNHLAIKDLMSLAYFMLSQEDDLSLASILKSPIFNLSEDDLFEICAKRQKTETVFSSLQKLANNKTSKFRHIVEYINEIIDLSKSYSPYDFFTLILGAKNGSKLFISRFGNEVIDILDEFLNFALRNEQKNYHTLQEFILELENYPPTIKREQYKNHNEVRIMTVHASKGLESPIVFLVDDGSDFFINNNKLEVIPSSNDDPGTPIYIPQANLRNSILENHIKYREKNAREEYHRLLYVGMTRASDRLIICSCKNKDKNIQGTWYDMVYKSFKEDKRAKEIKIKTSVNNDEWSALEWRVTYDESVIIEEEQDITQFKQEDIIPKEIFDSIPNDIDTTYILNPSILDKKDAPILSSILSVDNANQNHFIKRGLIIHNLLQVIFGLPIEDRKQYIVSYLKKNAHLLEKKEYDNLVLSVTSLLENPIISKDISDTSYSEVSVAGKLSLNKKDILVSGRIDLISVSNKHVIIFEYKTHNYIPKEIEDIPLSHIAQLSIYKELLKLSYTDKSFICVLIYVSKPKTFIITQHQLDQAILKLSI
ncbi:double-strand break repair helicase AddA [Candidatus Liberibacter americanus]|uniref:DNA 3'-5' helicase n=1 Tax=Candidatus Liberibacter americanus str. Sao Paulo TaxID=1261131 RepID=U6B6Y5_9HYPH|nr:double-strand break repair helicase AddA [Candidatus Liberibacter americanus]AHA27507.1 ATP-dependent exoDNAse [Candidatus Liberibacter americanus str. Sao Paulo]EMS36531.1 double-strand break repair helicase AddA [Candidatus Liberibacter americanus PW_SP]